MPAECLPVAYLDDRRFLVDLPLDPAGPAEITLMQAGTPPTTVAGAVFWTPTDPTDKEDSEDEIMIPAGDSLLLTATVPACLDAAVPSPPAVGEGQGEGASPPSPPPPLDGDADDQEDYDRKCLLSFERDTKMKVLATWLCKLSSEEPETLKVRVKATATSEAMGDLGASWFDAAYSDHRVHVTLDAPLSESSRWETAMDVACRNDAVQGKTQPDDVVVAIWAEFHHSSSGVQRQPKDGFNNDGGVAMGYWTARHDSADPLEVLLTRGDGAGRCGAWADLFNEAIRTHGIPGSTTSAMSPRLAKHPGATGLLVKAWRFEGPGSMGGHHPYIIDVDAIEENRIQAQNNDDSRRSFDGHWVVKYGGRIYDRSYGGGPYGTRVAHEAADADGIRSGSLAVPTAPKDPNNLDFDYSP
jgi:hypothetical protein